MIGRFAEPLKYRKNEKGNWVLTDEWKEWRQTRRTKESKPKETRPKKVVTQETHSLAWREIAYHPESGKRIFFCACMSVQGNPFKGCGAAGVQYSRALPIKEVIGSRFE